MKLGKLVVFTGPSGVGKGSIEKGFINNKKFNFHFTVSATTRKIRDSEKNGVDHWFIDKKTFKKWINEKKFLEYAIYIDNYYGTLKKEVEDKLKEGKNVFLEIELQGAIQVIKKIPNVISIFILPPSINELNNRLKNRSTESFEIIQKRIKKSYEEINYVKNNNIFKYKIINDNIDECIDDINKIMERELNV